jgi:hypothetical protein
MTNQPNTDIAAKTANVTIPLAMIARDAVPMAAQAFAMAEASEAADIVKAQRKLAKALEAATASKLDAMVSAARLIGVPLSAGQFDAQLSEAVRKALAAAGVDVSSALKRIKLVTLAINSGIATLEPVGGEKLLAYLARVGPLLEVTPVEGAEPVPTLLPDGRPIWERNAEGVVSKPGARTASPEVAAAREAAKAERAETLKTFSEALKGSKGTADDDEGGFNARRDIAAAIILMGNPDAAARLVTVLREHRDAYEKFATTTLAAADEADKARAKRNPPTEPTRDDKRLNRELLDMANATANA